MYMFAMKLLSLYYNFTNANIKLKNSNFDVVLRESEVVAATSLSSQQVVMPERARLLGKKGRKRAIAATFN